MDETSGGAVVVGVDGTEPSERAALWAARRAAVFGGPVVLVHGLRWPVYAQAHLHVPGGVGALEPDVTHEPMRRWAQEVLDDLARRCHEASGVEVRTEVASGEPEEALARAADPVAFVVVGHSDHGGVARFLLGSTAQRLARSCPWPVVVVRDEAACDERRARGPVVVGVDGSPVSARALRFAFGFAARHGVEVVVLHASDATTTAAAEPERTREEDALREGTGPVGSELARCARLHPDVPHRLVDTPGPPTDALLAASAESGLLVVGSHGKGAVRRAVLGSVSHALVDGAPCPVAVLPPRTGGS
ncbi:universal stress protein [Saccharothrix algeriensis]|uniref:Nucleotide-binding universal stress UspA family protein n=1 Tax=Saccharothrix algeriensis TaxID=173560 RepID=A0A8T8HX32_9PSEU|nr:universal stress protein [Saccharothrix algeriensis]MBM7814783.1 nucleotide-binding universal stress UspA family protein [Saccharothrix algeriensis]QTR03056.1 universal stress protein [Saccharothrix algeriensis]